MKDTDPKMLQLFFQLMMEKKPQERLIMGCSMFDSAKRIVKSAIMEQYPRISRSQIRQEIFRRFYGMDFDKTTNDKILDAIFKSR